jgi:hypothetical protein
MISLESERWGQLNTAYGAAASIPKLVRALEPFPPYEGARAEPYFSLWSALCHQGDIYTASYAAVPHLVRVIESAPEFAPWTLFSLVSAIEAARVEGKGPDMPQDLSTDYFEALSRVPQVGLRAAGSKWDDLRCRAILGCVATAKGHPELGSVIEELEPSIVEKFRDKWLHE